MLCRGITNIDNYEFGTTIRLACAYRNPDDGIYPFCRKWTIKVYYVMSAFCFAKTYVYNAILILLKNMVTLLFYAYLMHDVR